MHYQSIQELYETIRPLGRTLPEAGGGTLWCDWTLSGVSSGSGARRCWRI